MVFFFFFVWCKYECAQMKKRKKNANKVYTKVSQSDMNEKDTIF